MTQVRGPALERLCAGLVVGMALFCSGALRLGAERLEARTEERRQRLAALHAADGPGTPGLVLDADGLFPGFAVERSGTEPALRLVPAEGP